MTASRFVVQTLADPSEPIDPRVDAIELRLDLYPDLDVATHIASASKPVVVSVRRARDGGRWTGGERERLALLERARGATYVDLEWDLDLALAPGGTARRIVSFHDSEGVPDDLQAIYDGCLARGAEIAKIAVTPGSAVEALRLLDLPRTGIGMGDYGGFTRVLAPWTYCAREPVAPGMLSPEALFEEYRLGRRSLSLRPALLGVAGDPIEQSRSPALHNPRLEADGLDAIYLKYRVAELAPFWRAFVARGGRGLSVTAPLKLQAAALATEPAPEVAECGAANTLLSDGRAFNTDLNAFLDLVPEGTTEVLVMGAGGAARAAVAALRRLGVGVRVWARRAEQAADLGETVEATLEPAPVVINTTPAPPPPHGYLIDLRYGPGIAEPERGVGGLAFLEAQAAHQYRIFKEHLAHG